ncbi:hypothetical protein [Bradyrhizobium sp. 6(2017)]|uniref:hypothetical protein n=1 Tax=Bradyrhizobium sp. 6(2017) TaxID=1197460 RepID=UPI0013E13616|nr:hypothetical protein [Bradyrhizobium sp. 6(2017)]QIG97189.1 hypothetical protein G6P99_35540 [Bradyrhizobium sp. 6(2017)]
MRKRKNRDARIVATGIGAYPDADYRYLSDADWLNIQQRFGKRTKIPANLREQLSGVTAIYADMLQTPRLGRSLTGAVTEIELWCKRTEALKRAIWTDSAAEPNNAPQNLGDIIDRYFRRPRSPVEATLPLAHLAQFLTGAQALARYFVQILEMTDSDNKIAESWLVWAALVISFCRDQKIPIVSESRGSLHPGFFYLLKSLQATLPSKAQNSLSGGEAKLLKPSSPVKAGPSLRKSALRAAALADRESAEALYSRLMWWGLGLVRLKQTVPFESKASISRMLKRLVAEY